MTLTLDLDLDITNMYLPVENELVGQGIKKLKEKQDIRFSVIS